MTPVYFPFTYVSERSLKLLGNAFNKIGIFSITGDNIPSEMKKHQQDGFLEIIKPEGVDPEEFEISMNEYRNFWHLHRGSDLAITARGLDSIPLYDENSISEIRSDIRRAGKGQKAGKDPVLEKLLFLRIAHEYDLEQAEIAEGLGELDRIEKNLFMELKGELYKENNDETSAQGEPLREAEPGEHKPLSRLRSWSCLFQKCADPSSGIFVTDSRTVMDYLKENSSLSHAASVGPVPVNEDRKDAEMAGFRESLSKALCEFQKNGRSDMAQRCADAFNGPGSEKQFSMDIYIAPRSRPTSFFSIISGGHDLSAEPGNDINHTVIVFIS